MEDQIVNYNSAKERVRKLIESADLWGRFWRCVGIGVLVLSSTPCGILFLALLLKGNSFNDLTKNLICTTAAIVVTGILWSIGKLIWNISVLYSLRSGQLEDLEIYLKCISVHDFSEEKLKQRYQSDLANGNHSLNKVPSSFI